MTDNLELVIAKPVPARLIANANEKNVMTNKNPSPEPYKSVGYENDFDSFNIRRMKATAAATR